MTTSDWAGSIGVVLMVLAIGAVIIALGIGLRTIRNAVRKHNERRAVVKAAIDNSAVLKSARRLTDEYKKASASASAVDLRYSIALKSKRGLEKFDLAQWMVECIRDDASRIVPKISAIRHAENAYEEYDRAYGSVWSDRDGAPNELLADLDEKSRTTVAKREEALYRAGKVPRPTVGGAARFVASYTSPAGQNHYERSGELSLGQMAQILGL